MLGIRIKDSRDDEPRLIDLSDILPLIRERVITSQWICRDLDYTAMKDGRLSEILEARQKFSGTEFLQFAAKVCQIIDGRFEARTEGPSKNLWLVIVIFDSSWVDVWSSKMEVIERLKEQFKQINDLSPEDMKSSFELAQRKHGGRWQS
jgi:hypothetical protein